MDLVYVTGQNDFGAATERSRFIEQMLFEMPAYNSGISIHEQTYSAPVKVTAEQVQIEATPQIQERLVEYLERKLSPSALNTFIRCPLDFFYRYALQLGEAEELEEQVQSSTFGTCVHETLEDLFEPFLGQDLKVQMIDQMLPKADRLVEQKFLKSYSVQDLKTGNNLLTFEVAKSYVKKFLELEKKNITQAQAAGLNYQKVLSEEKLELILPIEWDGKTVNVKIFGVADRIGRLGDQIQLIDYKTGNVTPSELAFNDWEELITNPKKAKALQLAIYGLAYLKKNPTNDFKAGIYSFRNLGAGLLELKKQKMPVDPQELLEEFPKVLGEGVARILHQTAFTHDEKSEYCNYC